MPIIPAFRRLKQKDCKFEASLNYVVNSREANLDHLARPCLEKTKEEEKEKMKRRRRRRKEDKKHGQ
jgi:hypothetical protein